MIDDGRELLANQIGDIMTDRSVRQVGRGPTSILGAHGAAFLRALLRGKVAFNYGFTTDSHRQLSAPLPRAATRVEPAPYRVRDLARNPIVPIARRERLLRGWQLELVNDVGRRVRRLLRARRTGVSISRPPRCALPPLALSRVSRRFVLHRRDPQVASPGRLDRLPHSRLAIGRGAMRCSIRDYPNAAEVLLRHVVPQLSGRSRSKAGFRRVRAGSIAFCTRCNSSRSPSRRICR